MNNTKKKDQKSVLDAALHFKEAGKFSKAIDLLNGEVGRQPEDATMLALLSHCYLLENQVDAARNCLSKAKRIDADNASVGWNIARLLLKEKKPQDALNIARDTSQKYPNDIEGMGVLGACLSVNGEVTDSLRSLNSAIDLNPHYAEAFITRGLIRLSQENKTEALADLERAHMLKPHINKIWDLVIALKIEAQKHSDAILLLTNMMKIDPKNESRLMILALCYHHLRDFDSAVNTYKKALAIKPGYAEAYYNMGNTLKEHGKLEAAIEAFHKAIAIKPDKAEAYFNMSNALKEQGRPEKAIEGYIKTLAVKSDYPGAYNNMGITLKEQGKLEQAIEAYNNELLISPNNSATFNNMGNAFREIGKLKQAIAAYTSALAIKPDNTDALENYFDLRVQMLSVNANNEHDFDHVCAGMESIAILSPKYQIQSAIKAYLQKDFSKAVLHIKNFKACDQDLQKKLSVKNKLFCNAYSFFIEKLLEGPHESLPTSGMDNNIYHLGESHCLSYAHQSIEIGDTNFEIAPRITFGAKAFHFSQAEQNGFMAITETNFISLPEGSKVFLSFGEIDCRSNEGFIYASRKLQIPLEKLVTDTVAGYVQWFLELNKTKRHHLYFINIPAPVYDNMLTPDLNSEVAKAVVLFNVALHKYSLQHSFYVIDVFRFTVENNGFSNGVFHIDNHHLGPKALTKIEQQLDEFNSIV